MLGALAWCLLGGGRDVQGVRCKVRARCDLPSTRVDKLMS